jgi:hypothetical protein
MANPLKQEKLFLRKETLLNEGYLPKWNLVNVAKEFAQNYVYALSCLHAEGQTYWRNGLAVWEDFGQGFTLDKLLIGKGEQKDIEYAGGENSEGMKIGLLVACREGKQAMIEIPHYTIVGALEQGKLGDTELILYIYHNNRTNGAKFTLECDRAVFNDANASFGFISRSESKVAFLQNTLFSDNKSELYINGIKISGERKMLFSYNLVGKGLSNRDRNSISESEITRFIWNNILGRTSDKSIAEKILHNYTKNYMEYHNIPVWVINDDTKQLFRQVATEIWGAKVCYATGNKSDNRARYRNFKVLASPNGEVEYLFNAIGIVSSEQIAPTEKKLKHDLTKLKELDIMQRDNLKFAKKAIRKYYKPDLWDIKVVNALQDDYQNKCNGLCHYGEEIIYIDAEMLNTLADTLETLVHEAVHQVSRAEDCSADFEREFAKACKAFILREQIF